MNIEEIAIKLNETSQAEKKTFFLDSRKKIEKWLITKYLESFLKEIDKG